MSASVRTIGPMVVGCGEDATPDQLGAKGFRLAELAAQGVAVPRWIALTTGAADLVLAPLRERIEEIERGVPMGDAQAARRSSASIGQLVRTAAWPIDLRRELAERLRTLCSDRRLAVRSSAIGEDGPENSYAGQLTTLLFVDRDNVESAVQQCWAGAFSERAILYRQARGLGDIPVRVAIIIQQMVHSRVSGVAFTADPMTGVPAHVVVAGYGVGEGVVSDLVETDSYVRPFDSESWQITVRQKTRRAIPHRDGSPGTEIAKVPADDQHRPALTESELNALSAALKRIEERAGCPQDVEWAFDEEGAGALWILQARPISPLPAGELAIWDDSNIGESYPGLTLPLTYSFVRRAYERLFGQALREAGMSRAAVEKLRPALRHLVGVIRGRLYLNLLHYYRLFCAVPGLASTVRKWETALGITHPFDLEQLREKRPWRRAFLRLLGPRTGLRLAIRLLGLRREVGRFHDRVNELIRRYENADFSKRPLDDLLRTYERISEELLDRWTLLIYNDLFAFLFDDRLARLCGGRSAALGSGPDLHHRLLCGLTGIDSVAPLRSVLELVEEARKEPAVAALVRSGRPPHEVWTQITECADAATFRARAEDHLRSYGQRTIEELKFETQPLSETPWLLVAILRNCLDLGLRADDVGRRERGIQEAAEREFRELFHWNPFRRAYALWILKLTRRCVADRENMSYSRCRAVHVMRRLFRAMGEELARAGALRESRDVFYLNLEDLEAYSRGSLPESDLARLVDLRRAQYALFAQELLPHRIVCRGPVYRQRIAGQRAVSVPDPGGALRGVPCSPGLVRGMARVLRTPSPAEKVDGEILVAPTTEPGWAFLMLTANGLIVERGSILSHAAIIGRELGIPTIVGAEGATRWICSGDQLEMNGTTGEIRILRRGSSPSESEAC